MTDAGGNLIMWQADFAVTLANVRDMGGADLILMSPPYCDARSYGADVDWKLADYQRLGDAVKPALKPGAHCLMVLDAPVREWRPGYGTERGFMPWIVMLDWAERVGLRVPDRIAYGRQGVPGDFGMRFRNQWEPCLWFQAGADGYFDKWALAERVERYKGPASKRRRGYLDRTEAKGRAIEEGWRHRGSLWWYGGTGGSADEAAMRSEHPARFCTAFAEDAVRCFCPPGGLVVDPFVGGGTTAVAAIRHGRRFAGGDLLARPSDDLPWIDVARRRVLGDAGPVAPQKGNDDLPLFKARP